MYTPDDIMQYHVPRWEEIPDIGLYMDQVVGIMEKYLSIFHEKDDVKILTPTMINNYVKQKIILSPINKKYYRPHIAFLYIVCILKRLMGLNEIYNTKNKFLEYYKMEEAYDIFCEIFENSLKTTFKLTENKIFDQIDIKEIIIVKSVTLSYANIIYARYLISTITGLPGGTENNDTIKKTKRKKRKSE